MARLPKKYEDLDNELSYVEEALLEKLYNKNEESLYSFFVTMWDTYDPQKLVPNWHLQCMCEHIQAALARQIRRIIINIPPRSSKCLEENTLVRLYDGSSKPIKDVKVNDIVLSYDTEKGKHVPGKVSNVWKTGLKDCYRVSLESNIDVIATLEHRFYNGLNYSKLSDLKIGDSISVAWYDSYPLEEDIDMDIVAIEFIGKHKTYDIEVETYHNFTLANGIHSHNSTCASISAPCYHWLHNPGEKFWLISHSQALFTQNIVYARRILQHPRYKERWCNISDLDNYKFELSSDVNLKSRVENNKGGYLLGGSPKGSALGMGYTVAILDDILDSEDWNNPLVLNQTNSWYSQTFMNRSNDKENDVVIIVMQRLASNDITGYVLDQYKEQGWFVLNLPARYEPSRTFISPIGFNDRRTIKNELLDPIRLPDSFLNSEAKNPIIYNTRYQQNPDAITSGNLWQADWIQMTNYRPVNYSQMLVVWDLAFTANPTGSFSVGLVLGIHEDNFYIIDMWRKQAEVPEQINAIRKLKAKYPKAVIGIEAKANGHAAMATLQREIQNIYAFDPRQYGGSKEQRLDACSIYGQNKRIYIYNPPALLDDNYRRRENLEADYDAEVIRQELLSFPIGKNDDIVDCFSYGIQYLAEWCRESLAIITKGEHIKLTDEDNYLRKFGKDTYGNLVVEQDPYLVFGDIASRSDIMDISW